LLKNFGGGNVNVFKKVILGGLVLAMPVMTSIRALQPEQTTRLTIYNNNYALVNEQFDFAMHSGENKLRLEIPENIDLGSVYLRTLKPGAEVKEQNFMPAEITEQKLLDDYLGKEIRVVMKDRAQSSIFSGVLVEKDGGLYLKREDSLVEIKPDEIAAIIYPNTGERESEPSLEWIIESQKDATENFNLNYITAGINWQANYFAVLSKDEKTINLESIVTLTNNSGMDFKKSSVVLVAGQPYRQSSYSEGKGTENLSPTPSFQPGTLFDYHTYTLDRLVSLEDGSKKQFDFIDAEKVPVLKQYVIDFGQYFTFYSADILKTNAGITINLVNNEKSNLGIPLPAGTIKFYKENNSMADFIGEASISHTPKGEKLELTIGRAFDITAEKKQTKYLEEGETPIPVPSPEKPGEYSQSTIKKITQGYQITVNNAKETSETVNIFERIPLNSEITTSSVKYEKITPTLIKFILSVPHNGSAALDYEFVQTIT